MIKLFIIFALVLLCVYAIYSVWTPLMWAIDSFKVRRMRRFASCFGEVIAIMVPTIGGIVLVLSLL